MVFPPITSPFYFSFSTLFLFFFTLPAFLCIPAKEKRLYWKNGPKRKDRRQLYNFKYIFLSILIFLFFFYLLFSLQIVLKKEGRKKDEKTEKQRSIFLFVIKVLIKVWCWRNKSEQKKKKTNAKKLFFFKNSSNPKNLLVFYLRFSVLFFCFHNCHY